VDTPPDVRAGPESCFRGFLSFVFETENCLFVDSCSEWKSVDFKGTHQEGVKPSSSRTSPSSSGTGRTPSEGGKPASSSRAGSSSSGTEASSSGTELSYLYGQKASGTRLVQASCIKTCIHRVRTEQGERVSMLSRRLHDTARTSITCHRKRASELRKAQNQLGYTVMYYDCSGRHDRFRSVSHSAHSKDSYGCATYMREQFRNRDYIQPGSRNHSLCSRL
jgi:hypothetical protein